MVFSCAHPDTVSVGVLHIPTDVIIWRHASFSCMKIHIVHSRWQLICNERHYDKWQINSSHSFNKYDMIKKGTPRCSKY